MINKRLKPCKLWQLCLPVLLAVSTQAFAITLPLPVDGSNVVGRVQTATVRSGENLNALARRYDVGYYEVLEANPHINPMHMRAGSKVAIPSRYVLPNAPREGIVINLAELRLYYYPPGGNVVVTEPIGIGRQGWQTPEGQLKIIQKKANPSWRVPAAVAAESAANGKILPKVVPPGPNNPLGQYALRLSKPNYLIHGTNRPNGVGRRVSAGCIRMYPEDIEYLFGMVSVGTPVNIVNQPYKIGHMGNRIFLEAHRPLNETRREGTASLNQILVNAIDNNVPQAEHNIKWTVARKVARSHTGIPTVIGVQ